MGDAGRQMFQAISDKNMKVINIVLGNKPYPKEMWLHVNNSQQNSLMMAVQLAPEQDAATFTAVILSVQEPRTPLDAVNKFGQTALMMAAKKGYADVVKLLLEAGANYELRNQEFKTAIEMTSDNGVKAAIQAKIESNAELARNAKLHEQGKLLVKLVRENNNVPRLQMLLEKQLDKFPELPMYCEVSDTLLPIEIAFENRNLEIMHMLLETGIDLNKLPLREHGRTLLQQIYDMKRIPSYPETQRSRDVEEERISLLRMLLEFGIDTSAPNADGSPVIFEAVYKNWLEDVKILLDKGVSVNSREVSSYQYRGKATYRQARGDTLLILAARRNNAKLVELLLLYVAKENRIDVDLVGYNGMTAFMWAAYNNNSEILKLLLPYAAVNMRTEEGYSALLFAIDRLHFETMYLLIRHSYVNVDLAHNNGETPLMMATRKLYSIPKAYETVESDELTKEELQHNSRLDKFIKELVNERKAKVVTETKNKLSAYNWAKMKGHTDLMVYYKIMISQQEIEANVMAELHSQRQFLLKTGLKDGNQPNPPPKKTALRRNHSIRTKTPDS